MKYLRLLALGLAVAATDAASNSFGVYDARTLGMGGTAVAVGNVNIGHFYNPALTAFHVGTEENTRDGRHSLHLNANLITDGLSSAAETISESLDGQLGVTIDRINGGLEPAEDAQEGYRIAADLSRAMRAVDNVDLGADMFLGYSVSEPADRRGGAFYIGSRVFGTAIAKINPSDYVLIEDYVEEFAFISSLGTEGVNHPELYNIHGQLIDPSGLIKSTALGTLASKSEMGMSFSKVYYLWGEEFSLGAAPKVVHLNIYDIEWRLKEGGFSENESNVEKTYFNADLGFALNIADSFRVGLAIKDILTKKITTGLGNQIEFGTYQRIGMAYFHPRFTFGVDVDLGVSPDVQLRNTRKDISAGMEMSYAEHWKFRGGYRKDLQGIQRDNFSAGFAWTNKYFSIDAGYTTNMESQGAALEISYIH